ncbi:hypothetical protein BENNIE_27 [Arthrobacter phage Bennie]|uniref:Uncharacterized protein n=4 Tax=Korravirus bennie TaxID=1982077 RepID=A0A386K926_9CAUD|nr:hypothetical protein FDH55_gp27 [Arthrobacter phage Bennie]ALY08564.1 hypothetical protein BENNIE_27 [Arthrobacter phage Bennie]AYD81723.1 hypothetical protein Moki_27 [Arthrobacter phage Moki]AZS08204.1 hypothetical protein SEA_HUCKLEBERRY_27 [Arthrobacter phage Huckleberry]AZS12435.1 hypothetical protein SEA_HEADNERD_27 [Arthrobacter phage HeadNerd]
MARGTYGFFERLDKCDVCGTPKDQHRKDQKLRPGKFPCLHGGSHKFSVWVPDEAEDRDCRSCNPEFTGHYRHTCKDQLV